MIIVTIEKPAHYEQAFANWINIFKFFESINQPDKKVINAVSVSAFFDQLILEFYQRQNYDPDFFISEFIFWSEHILDPLSASLNHNVFTVTEVINQMNRTTKVHCLYYSFAVILFLFNRRTLLPAGIDNTGVHLCLL